jgi:hypothetical protein
MDNLSLSQGGNLCFTSGALDAGTNSGTIKTTATITYTVNGEFKSKAATDNISIAFTGPSFYGTPADGSFTGATGGSTRLYAVFLNAAGTFSVEPGPIVNTAELAAGTAALHWPGAKRDRACCGAVRIAVTAGTTFIPGTTALNATGVTTTYVNVSAVPGEPIRS